MERWVEELLPMAIDWTLHYTEDMVVKTTKVGTVMSALSTLTGVKSKGEFVSNIIRGLGSNFTLELRERFAKEIFARSKEHPVEENKPLNSYYSEASGSFKAYVSENEKFDLNEFLDPLDPPLVRTVGIQRDIDLFRSWLEGGQPFIVVGPEGCGKNLMLRSAFKQLKSTQVATLYCNAQTTAGNVIQKLLQVCAQSSNAQGRLLRPKDTSKLILYLKDINLPTPDKYNTIQLIAFLQQLVTYHGFYDNLDFVNLERIQIVASMNPSSTVGRHLLSPRFTANVRIACVDYPTRDELIHVYTQYLRNILKAPTLGNTAEQAGRLAQSMVDLFGNVKSRFPYDEHRHYLFTPRDITQWGFSLLRYEAKNANGLYEAWGYEAVRVFKDRLVSREHSVQFDAILNSALRQGLGYNDGLKAFFLTWSATHEAVIKGIPSMGRASEEDLKTIISHGLVAYEREFRELHFHLFDESMANTAKVDRNLSMPGGCVLMVGESGVGRRNTTLLVSHMLNLQFFSPNITREYSDKEFRKDLKTILQIAGVEGKGAVLFLEDYQLVKPEFLQLLNSLLGSGEVPGLYLSEEIEPLLASLADQMRQDGKYKTLYDYFCSLVRKNLRIVLSLDHSHPLYSLYTSSNPALFTRCSILWLQPWSKESMNAIAHIELHEQLQSLNDKQEITDLSIAMHRSVNKSVMRNYMDLLKTFRKVYTSKSTSQGGQSNHLKAGLAKLKEAESLVNDLKIKAEHQKKLLAIKQKEADQALEQITKAMARAAESKQEQETLAKQLQTENTNINKRKSQVEIEMTAIQPLLEEAQRAVGSIRKESLDELKALRLPPEPVHDVLSAVLRLMGNYDSS